MKYGEQLEESVPQWSLRELSRFPLAASHSRLLHPPGIIVACQLTNDNWTDNLDYNSLKHEIKAHTTRDQATAIAIPGHQDRSLRKFEDGLYLELCRQHDRVGLFCLSKADEISRRLGTATLRSNCFAFIYLDRH